MLHYRGIPISSTNLFSKSGRTKLADIISQLDAQSAAQLQTILMMLGNTDAEYDRLQKELQGLVKANAPEEFKYALSITGFSLYAASVALTIIGNVNRFSNHGKLICYFGLNSTVRQSNKIKKLGHISHQGNSLVRAVLSQVAINAIRRTPSLNETYNRIKQRRGTGRAIVAIMVRLTKRLYYIIKRKEIAFECNERLYAKKCRMLQKIKVS